MPNGAKADIKFGFWAGMGLVLLLVVLMVAQLLLSRARARSSTGG